MTQPDTRTAALRAFARAVQILDGPSAAARLFGVTPQAVTFWLRGERSIPAAIAIEAERETRARGEPVTVEEICPGVDWAVVRNNEAGVAPARA